MKAYKGFQNQDDGTMVCRDKTYREGETYTESSAEICKRGMHACLVPLDTLTYYAPDSSVYHEVEVGDDAKGKPGEDSKVVSKRLTVGVRLGVACLVKAHLGWVFERVEPTSGYYAHAATTGNYAHAATTGNSAHAATTGYSAHAATTGNSAHAATTGNSAISAALGGAHAKAGKGGWLVLAEYDGRELLNVIAVKVGRKRHGVRVKPDTWYLLRGGDLVRVDENGNEVAK